MATLPQQRSRLCQARWPTNRPQCLHRRDSLTHAALPVASVDMSSVATMCGGRSCLLLSFRHPVARSRHVEVHDPSGAVCPLRPRGHWFPYRSKLRKVLSRLGPPLRSGQAAAVIRLVDERRTAPPPSVPSRPAARTRVLGGRRGGRAARRGGRWCGARPARRPSAPGRRHISVRPAFQAAARSRFATSSRTMGITSRPNSTASSRRS